MSGYKRLRRDHQASLARPEESCRQEMERHKHMLDREYEQLLTQFSRELERLQLKHQDEVINYFEIVSIDVIAQCLFHGILKS